MTCPRVLTKEQMVAGLKAGHTLRIDRRDAPELVDVRQMEQDGLVVTKLIEVDEQYSYLKVMWR